MPIATSMLRTLPVYTLSFVWSQWSMVMSSRRLVPVVEIPRFFYNFFCMNSRPRGYSCSRARGDRLLLHWNSTVLVWAAKKVPVSECVVSGHEWYANGWIKYLLLSNSPSCAGPIRFRTVPVTKRQNLPSNRERSHSYEADALSPKLFQILQIYN
ncbi:hypothetical protein P152DRAFT_275908 [Eremomyces bilateralis CBS 781.70]|uniref:Uncharacterized protein n=1 Tax=Eremomyces bilateralis CBS 781.70 TaxID=1392243 RepID=A0A6G1G8S6_9PEZI|nr:uncharacterized protein P152DRAFT_275908 [Eremomyces bilateralis CBS 781.70]KAF1814505.1 hypothetical protein P152DRAFT_275908 [Eremomyces bilateralis CBS 781.70]